MSSLGKMIKFYIFILLHIPSLVCTAFTYVLNVLNSFNILFFFVSTNEFRLLYFQWNRIVDQIFGILLVINTLIILIELPFTLIYLHQDLVYYVTICPIWILINYTLFISSVTLIAWASIERYFFIFKENYIYTHRWTFHFIPIGFLIFYVPLFYIGVVLFYPCKQDYNLSRYICNGPCYLLETIPSLIDWCLNVVVPMLVTMIMNIVLITCSFKQKRRMRQNIVTGYSTQKWVNKIDFCKTYEKSVICTLSVVQSN